ncbi:hypothetical protein A464_3714 [Salmonella bongori N268-08]|uniref:Uncharacterized protein n=1 Tax=Salmonella bongori N268-08 TaxID=1197719 RepID=S5N1N0_SALBN|nr:hypothetical protein A464_3714 [Salmonella bongori N268-08]
MKVFLQSSDRKGKRYRLVNMLPCAKISEGQETDDCSK